MLCVCVCEILNDNTEIHVEESAAPPITAVRTEL